MIHVEKKTMDIRRLIEVLRREWLRLILCTLGGIAITFGGTFLLTPKYEAMALIRSGRTIGMNGEGVLIDDISSLIARLRAFGTLEDVLRASGRTVNKNNLKQLRSATRLAPTGDSVLLRVRDSSYKGAIDLVKQYIEEIQKQEAAISETSLTSYKESLAQAQEENKQLLARLNGVNTKKNKNDAEYVMILTTILQKDAEIRKLSRNLTSCIEPVKIIVPVSCLPWPISPDRVLFAVLGAFMGLAAGLVWIFSNTWEMEK